VLVGGVTALYLAGSSSLSRVGAMGLGLLACCWLGSLYCGLKGAILKNSMIHRYWFVRNYVMTLSFSLFPLCQLVISHYFTVSDDLVINTLCWTSWLVPLLLLEFTPRKSKLLVFR